MPNLIAAVTPRRPCHPVARPSHPSAAGGTRPLRHPFHHCIPNRRRRAFQPEPPPPTPHHRWHQPDTLPPPPPLRPSRQRQWSLTHHAPSGGGLRRRSPPPPGPAAAAAVPSEENDAAAELATLSRVMRLPFGDRAFAARLDDADTLAPFRSRFHIPTHRPPTAASLPRVSGSGSGDGSSGGGGEDVDGGAPWGEHGGGDANGSDGTAAHPPLPPSPPAGEAEQPDGLARVPPPTPTHQDPPAPRPVVYLCGNSLGLMPVAAGDAVRSHLSAWAARGVDGHFCGPEPWATIEDTVATADARALVGAAKPHEIVYMNSLTVNLHLMMTAFYRPTPQRHAILIEDHAFPSDIYAVASQVSLAGFDPATAILRLRPRPGEAALRDEDIVATIAERGPELALILLPGVQYYTGQVLPMAAAAAAARAAGVPLGLDLAHAVGNVPLALHAWGVDWAVWCTYKYLNGGPGAVGGLFLHDRHAGVAGSELPSGQREEGDDNGGGGDGGGGNGGGGGDDDESDDGRPGRPALPRLAGWWGHERASRFTMGPTFRPQRGAPGFQLSNPPVLALAPVAASLRLFAEAGGMPALTYKAARLTAYLEALLVSPAGRLARRVTVITPSGAGRRGCQLSVRLAGGRVGEVRRRLGRAGVVVDTREPDVMRVAPVPLYNSFGDVWRFAEALADVVHAMDTEVRGRGE